MGDLIERHCCMHRQDRISNPIVLQRMMTKLPIIYKLLVGLTVPADPALPSSAGLPFPTPPQLVVTRRVYPYPIQITFVSRLLCQQVMGPALTLLVQMIFHANCRHQEIVKIHIRHYEPPKCIVDGRLRYELVTILQANSQCKKLIDIRVVHGSHFWAIFGSFSNSFLAHFHVFGGETNKGIRKF